MSTLKSSAEHLTLNADGSGNDIKFQSNATEVAAIDQSGNLTLSGTVDGVDIAARDAILTSTTTTAGAALPKAGGTMTGNLVMGTNLVDGIDISARDAVLTSTTTTAGAALPKAGGTMTGALKITKSDASATYNALHLENTGEGFPEGSRIIFTNGADGATDAAIDCVSSAADDVDMFFRAKYNNSLVEWMRFDSSDTQSKSSLKLSPAHYKNEHYPGSGNGGDGWSGGTGAGHNGNSDYFNCPASFTPPKAITEFEVQVDPGADSVSCQFHYEVFMNYWTASLTQISGAIGDHSGLDFDAITASTQGSGNSRYIRITVDKGTGGGTTFNGTAYVRFRPIMFS